MRRNSPTQSPEVNASRLPTRQLKALIIMAAALSGCVQLVSPASPTVDPALTDRSILTGDPCQPPCWYGLSVGTSTEQEMLRAVGALPFLDPSNLSSQAQRYRDRLEEHTYFGTRYYLECAPPASGTCVAPLVVDGVLKEVIIRPNYDITFSDAVSQLGDPEFVRFIYHGYERECHLVLQWNSKGIMLSGELVDQGVGAKCDKLHTSLLEGESIDPSTRIDTIWYVLPQDMQGPDELNDPSYLALFPWRGFRPDG